MVDLLEATTTGLKTLIFQQYEERMWRRGRKPDTIANFVKAAQRLEAWLDEWELRIEDLNSDLMEEYFASLRTRHGQPFAATTKELQLVELRAAFKVAHSRGLLQKDPTFDVELPKQSDKPIVVLSSDQLCTLLAACTNQHEYRLMVACMYTGMRRFELAKMGWEDVNLDTNCIQVVGKGGKHRLVPIHPVLRDLLVADGFRVGAVLAGRLGGSATGSLDMRLTNISKRAGVEVVRYKEDGSSDTTKTRFHDFRRTVASSLSANGVPDHLIDKIMGWSRQSMFDKHYRSVPDKMLQEAILRLYADNPVSS